MKLLEKTFAIAKSTGKKYVAVLIEMEGFPTPEVIINTNENIDTKLAYYQKTYDENLNHKFAKGIRIIYSAYGDSFAEIESKFKDDEDYRAAFEKGLSHVHYINLGGNE